MMVVMSPLAREVDDTIRALDADTASKLEAVLKDAMELAKHISAMSMAEDDSAAITIRNTPGVCGGDACLGNTRIAVWMLEEARRAGVTDAELLQDYPSLNARDLAAAWTYVDTHPEEIENAIQANRDA